MSDSADRLADALAPRYRVLRELGVGGMATVYLAEDGERGEKVAVKVLDSEVASALGPARFQREIHIAGTLRHPRILPVLDSGEADGLLFYTMPFVDGESLRQLMEREGPLAVEDALAVVRGVAEGLDHAHGLGVVHRDIKPENILMDDSGVFIADFGIARLLGGTGDDRVTATGHSVGTAAYASPEQGGGDGRFDARSDVYSLGCVLFEMLAGEPPFTGPSSQAVIARHMAQPAPTIAVVRPDLPPQVTAAIQRALAKAPADRFRSAGAFVKALEAPRPVPSRSSVRRRWIGALVLTALVIGVGVFGPGLLPDNQELDPDKILVLPFAVTGAIGDALTGWDVALAIEAGLEHAEPLKFIDGWAHLGEEHRADPASITAAQARALAWDRGAGYYLHGVIRGVDTASVVVRLYDALGDSLLAQETLTASGGTVSLGTLGMRALLSLLPRLVDPERVVSLEALLDREPSAQALFLQGERAYRQFRFQEALELYSRAVEEDSLHAFAAIKAAQAADWETDYRDARAFAALAVGHQALLPPKYAHFARGLDAFFRGEAEVAQTDLRAALEGDPEWSEAATALAEVYLHLLPQGATDADSAAAYWLRRARSEDAAFAPPLYHLAEIALRAGDVRAVEGILEEWRRLDPDTVFVRQVELSLACIKGEPDGFDWAAHVTDHAQPVLQAGAALAGRASQSRCAEGAFSAILDADLPVETWHNMALLGLQGLALAKGEYARADSLLQRVQAEGLGFVRVYFAYDAIAGAPFAERADSYSRTIVDSRDAGLAWITRGFTWLAGLWALRSGNDSLAAGFAEVTVDSAGPRYGSRRALEAHILAFRGDTAGAIALLEDTPPSVGRSASETGRVSLQVDWWEHRGFERLLLAELYALRGDHEAAYATASLLDHPTPLTYLPLLPRSLLLRLRSAEAMNRPDLARVQRDRLQALGWTDGDDIPPSPR